MTIRRAAELGSKLARIFALGALAASAPLAAQSFYTDDVAFFERVVVGDVEVTPVAILADRRCGDADLCFRDDRFVVSLVLHDYRGISEVILELDRPAAVPGGYLILRDAGTRPTRRGAQPLANYALDLEFVPFEDF